MQPKTTQPTGQSKRSLNIVGLIIIAVVLVVGGGYYLSVKKPASNKSVKNAYIKGLHNQDYSKLDNYHLLGTAKGAGISFDKPADYKLVIETKDHQQASFSHSLKAPTFAPLGALHVATVASATETTKTMLDSMSKTFSNPKTDSYKSMAAATQQFVSARFSPLYNITFEPARSLTTGTLKGNAWAFDLSATPKTAGNKTTDQSGVPSNATNPAQAQPLPKSVPSGFENYKGSAVLIIGKKTFYYFVVYNTDYNWQNNAAVWQKVEDSIKIDQ